MSFSATSACMRAFEKELGYKLPAAPANVRIAGQQSLYGARCEAFYVGRTEDLRGELFVFDFKAQYGRIMAEEEFPDFIEAYESKEPKEKFWIADVEMDVDDVFLPPVPWHCPKRDVEDRFEAGSLLFPVGRIDGMYTCVDLAYPSVHVRRFKRVINFPHHKAFFKGFVERFIPHNDNEVSKAIKKNVYTSFSGKFAQSNVRTLLIRNDPSRLRIDDYRTGQFFGDWVLVERRTPWPRSSNFVWTAFINAYGRRNLLRLFDSIVAFGGRPLYCNTDGCAAVIPSAIHARRVVESFPQLPLKCESKAGGKILGPRAYMYRNHDGTVEIAAGGIPKRLHGQIIDGKDEIWAEVPDTFFQLMQRGQIENELRNSWRKKSFTYSQKRKLGRTLRKDGWTEPIRIDG